MKELYQKFHDSYSNAFERKVVYTDSFPIQMKASGIDNDGWIEWKPIKGTLEENAYRQLEKEFGVLFPKSFVDWHRAFYFLEGDCSIIRLPISSPTRPLENLRERLDWFIPTQLIPHKLYPFGEEGNDAGPLIFDGREPVIDNEFPIRFYDHSYGGDLNGLSEVIFSSFTKLLECVTHYLNELKSRKNFEIISDFFSIDPKGAGKTGIDYWLNWSSALRTDFEESGR